MSFTMIIETAEDLEASRINADREAAKQECGRRIMQVADLVTQTNLLAAYQTGDLSPDKHAAFIAGHQWIRSMQAAWPVLAINGSNIHDDANWPATPDGVAELAAEY